MFDVTSIKACVFDMDGTMVDNMRAHADAWVAWVHAMGLPPVPRATFEGFAGKKNAEILPLVCGTALSADDIARFSEQKEALYREQYAPQLRPIAGLVPLLSRLQQRGTALAVASAAPAKNRAFVLDGLQLRRFFSVVVGGEDAARGKPAPDLFLAAAQRLGTAPQACLAFEDATLGVMAAVAAGMPCVGVTTTVSAAALTAVGACFTCEHYEEWPTALHTLFAG